MKIAPGRVRESSWKSPWNFNAPLFLLSCFWSVWSFNCRKIYSADSALFALLDKHTAIQVKTILVFPKQNYFKKGVACNGFQLFCLKNHDKSENLLDKKMCYTGNCPVWNYAIRQNSVAEKSLLENKDVHTYAVFTTADPTTAFFGLFLHKWEIFRLVGVSVQSY